MKIIIVSTCTTVRLTHAPRLADGEDERSVEHVKQDHDDDPGPEDDAPGGDERQTQDGELAADVPSEAGF